MTTQSVGLNESIHKMISLNHIQNETFTIDSMRNIEPVTHNQNKKQVNQYDLENQISSYLIEEEQPVEKNQERIQSKIAHN